MQLAHSIKIQFLFNLQLMDKAKTTDLHSKLKESLFSPGREFNLDKDWRDHQEFLKYWAQN